MDLREKHLWKIFENHIVSEVDTFRQLSLLSLCARSMSIYPTFVFSLQVFLHANGTGTKYATVEVDSESAINADLLLDNTKQNVYVLTDKKVRETNPFLSTVTNGARSLRGLHVYFDKHGLSDSCSADNVYS